jgi:hypothetical protein
MPMLRLLASNSAYRHLINFTLIRRTTRRSLEIQAKRFMPNWLKRWLLNRFYRMP